MAEEPPSGPVGDDELEFPEGIEDSSDATEIAEESPDGAEPPRLRRFPPISRTDMSYEMVEQGPLANAPVEAGKVAAQTRDGGRGIQIEDPDRELVERWQGGELAAFEELVRRHERRIFRLLMRMMGNREEAEDVAQETFLSLHRHGHRFRSEARFSTFLYRVAVNAALNRRRALGRSRTRVQKLTERQEAGDDLPVQPRDPEDAADGGQVTEAVRQALDTLSPSLRAPVVLYDIEGLAYGEIADILGVAEGTVKSRIHRARHALRAALSDLVGERIGGTKS